MKDVIKENHVIVTGALMFLALLCVAASAAVPNDMIGKWRWQQFTIEVTECQRDRMCAKVIAGPKSVGMEVFGSEFVTKGVSLFGQIVDPGTKEIYNTQFQRSGPDKWRLDGCTALSVCRSGEFVRVK
jgi:hypothetical protein